MFTWGSITSRRHFRHSLELPRFQEHGSRGQRRLGGSKVIFGRFARPRRGVFTSVLCSASLCSSRFSCPIWYLRKGRVCTLMFTVALLVIAQIWNEPRCPSTVSAWTHRGTVTPRNSAQQDKRTSCGYSHLGGSPGKCTEAERAGPQRPQACGRVAFLQPTAYGNGSIRKGAPMKGCQMLAAAVWGRDPRENCIQITVLVVILSIVLPNVRIVEKPATCTRAGALSSLTMPHDHTIL